MNFKNLDKRLSRLECFVKSSGSPEEFLAKEIKHDPEYQAALAECVPVLQRIEETLKNTGCVPALSPQELEIVREFQNVKFAAIDRHREQLGLEAVDLCRVYRAMFRP